MPKNKITISDRTSSGATFSSVRTVYIPGLTLNNKPSSDLVLCTTVDELEYEAEQLSFDINDLSFKLAKYLIDKYGFYVVYQGIINSTVLTDSSPDSSAFWDNVRYSDFDIDFITTGGFGITSAKAGSCAEKKIDCVYLADHEKNINIVDVYTLLYEAPYDWASNYSSYYKKNVGTYNIVPTSINIPKWEPNKYYYKLGTSPDVYELTTSKPNDWNLTYNLYYTYTIPTPEYINVTLVAPVFDTTKFYFTAETEGEQVTEQPADWETNYSNYWVADTEQGTRTQVVGVIPVFTIYTYYNKISGSNESYALTVRQKFESLFTNGQSFAAGFTPWFKSNIIVNDEALIVPASFGYLFALGNSLKSNPLYFAVAGPTRGVIPELVEPLHKYNRLDVEVLEARAATGAVELDAPGDNVGIAINPIANIRPHGYIIYGNRTLYKNLLKGTTGELKATSFLNIRNMVSLIIARAANLASNQFKFDQNDTLLWSKFTSLLNPVLDSLVSGGGIVGYKLTREITDKKARLKAKLKIVPIEAVEDLDLDIILTDSLDVIID